MGEWPAVCQAWSNETRSGCMRDAESPCELLGQRATRTRTIGKGPASMFPSSASHAPARSPESNIPRMNWFDSLQKCCWKKTTSSVSSAFVRFALNTAKWLEMQIQGLLYGTIRKKVGCCDGKHEVGQPGFLRPSPGPANHQPCDPTQALTFLICGTGAMRIKNSICCEGLL